MEVQTFTAKSFFDGINSINDSKITMVMFSKPNCKYCIKCYEDYSKLAEKLDKNIYTIAKINCEEYSDIGSNLKNSPKLNKPVTYPTFIMYKNNMFYKQYYGLRTTQEFKLALYNISTEKSKLADKIDSIFPIRNYELWDLYRQAKAVYWDEKEIAMNQDKFDWDNKLNDDERFFLSNILAFFAQSDQIVNINLEERFMADVETLPRDIRVYVKMFYAQQVSMEWTHSIVYELLLDTCITDKKNQNIFKNAIEHVPAIKKKSQWAEKWIESKNASFATRLICFAILEGIFFSGSFAAIYWIKERNILPGLTKSNEFIARDESQHYMYAISLFRILKTRNDYNMECDNETIIEILKEAIEIECEYITASFSCKLIGMNANEMIIYIKYIGDFLLKHLNIKPIYNVENPFEFMTSIALMNKNSFFESRTTEYAKSNSTSSSTLSALSIDDDF